NALARVLPPLLSCRMTGWKLATVFCCWLASSLAADFTVAPHGSDANPCTDAKPFATLARARDAIRAAKTRAPDRDYEVAIRGGLYRVSETIVFSLTDSAAAGHTITYAAYPG